MHTRTLLVVILILGLLAPTAAAAPLAGPCVPGAAYDSACDANQDGSITVTDIQLAAGHWNQTGTFVSDNNHTHLGQTWTGNNNPLTIQGSFGAPSYAVMTLNNTVGHGLAVNTVALDGIYVGIAGYYGLVVNHAGQDGVYVGTAGNPSSSPASAESNGFEVAGAQGHGVFVGRADREGLHVNSAGLNGVYVDSTGYTGFTVYTAGTVGFNVHSAGSYGVYVGTAGYDGINAYGAAYAGNFVGDINVTGNCIGCRQANFAVNAGERPLQPGDVVSVQAVTTTDFDTAPALWQVVPAQPGKAAVGVVAGKAELVIADNHRPSETGKRLVPREGAAGPGEYVTIIYSGPVQVKMAPGAGAIAAGTRLTAATDGQVRPLQTRTIEGMLVSEGAPVLGVALEAAQDGLVWVLVARQ